ncbi:glycosyltransferase family 4 protein [Rhodobacter sp. NSM]|uniref:glycosyltransferase family 4 protein n=1 Tax=Rhodobacter sp. NSM TaxID=3457501 RepID=UPI003FD18A5D
MQQTVGNLKLSDARLPSFSNTQDARAAAPPRQRGLRVLFTLGDPYLPQRTGGAQSSTDQLAAALQAEGHEVAVLSGLEGGGWTEYRARLQRRLLRRDYAQDRMGGYKVFRTWDPVDASEVVRHFRPDVAVVQNDNTRRAVPLAQSLAKAGVPVVFYFRNVELEDLGGDPSSVPGARFVANSDFTARTYAKAFGIRATVVPPLVEPERYRTKSSRENVTFINPVPVKGLDTALAVAERCPDIPFVFVESWPLSPDRRQELEARIASLPNVTLRMRTNDMRSVYGNARILLAPSVWQEAWGRVATEAQFCGIPVIGSNQGGLPEAIGYGGRIVPSDASADRWAAEVRSLWDDQEAYASASLAAFAHARRPEIRGDHQLRTFLLVLRSACNDIARQAGTLAARATAVALPLL